MREGNCLNVALSRAKHALYIIGNYKAMDRLNRKQNTSLFVRRLLKYISQNWYRVPVLDDLMITLPDTANEEQHDVHTSATWDDNSIDLDGTTAQLGASNDNPATGGAPDATDKEQQDVQTSGDWGKNGMELDDTPAQPGASDNSSNASGPVW